MSTEDEDIDGKGKIFNIILIILLIVAVFWANYLYFIKHISSNPERINNFLLTDNNINKFKIPVTAVFFYPYQKEKIFSSQMPPQILVVPHSGYLFSTENLQKAYTRLIPWKDKIKKIVLVVSAAEKENGLKAQLPLIKKTFGGNVNISTFVYLPEEKENLAAVLAPYIQETSSLVIFSADLSGYYTSEEKNAEIDSAAEPIVKIAQQNHLYPKVYDLVNFEDINEQSFRINEQKKVLSTLEQEVENLSSFAHLYGYDLLKIAKVSLDEAVVYHKQFSPSRENYADVLFNRGAVYVDLYQNGKLRGSSGALLPSQAVAFAVAQNSYMAALEDKNFSPISKEDLPNIKIKLSLLSGYERIIYKNEADLLNKLQVGKDGLVLRDGNRQGVLLPYEWQQYSKPAEFLNNLKIKAGMSPAYWSNSIKIYRFRTVEISKNDD